MITLLHGDQIEASRAEFNKLKESAKGKEIRTLDGRNIDPAKLTQAIESQSMFGGNTIVFIENLFGKLGRKTKLIESLADILKNSSADVILWEDKEVGVTVTKSLGNVDIRLFKTPPIIFQFLDKPSISLYATLMEHEAPELVNAMLARRIRLLIQARDGGLPLLASGGVQGWQASRLTQQAKLFTMERLLTMYKKLLDMEYSIKSGNSPFTLKELTEQFLLDL